MNNKGTSSSVIIILRNLINSKFSVLIFCAVLLIQLIIFFAFFHIQPLGIFPKSENTIVDFYNDSLDNGNSIITGTISSDTFVSVNFILKEGFVRPYIGIGFEDKAHKEFNISDFNKIRVELSGKGIRPMFVYLILKDSSRNIDGEIFDRRYMCHYIEIDEKKQILDLKIDDFYTPDWWFDRSNLSPATINSPSWNKLIRIALATGLTPSWNKEKSIQIYSILFYRNNTDVVLIMIIIQLFTFAVLILIFYLKTASKKSKNSFIINYRAVTYEQKQTDKNDFLDFINDNFQNSDLNLSLISKITGVSQRNITEGISLQFNCNVRTYINQIRINEARRLLKESDLHISEIAYKVGFSSPSNFNRVFKNLTGQSPSEFLQKIE